MKNRTKTKNIFICAILIFVFTSNMAFAQASDSQRISDLEKRVAVLESEIKHLQEQEARASKYLKCIQGVKGNYLTFPIRVLNCLRK